MRGERKERSEREGRKKKGGEWKVKGERRREIRGVSGKEKAKSE